VRRQDVRKVLILFLFFLAPVADLPLSFLTKVSDQIVRRVSGINRVVYDITTKPPATIEWE
jgi:GMP synthase (glutamine-hydrolysing)